MVMPDEVIEEYDLHVVYPSLLRYGMWNESGGSILRELGIPIDIWAE
jgi:hypothetical protein